MSSILYYKLCQWKGYSFPILGDHVHTSGESEEKPRIDFLYRVEQSHYQSDDIGCHLSNINSKVSVWRL